MVTNLSKYSIKIFEKQFEQREDELSRDTYIRTCGWLAKNVYSSPSYSENISVQIKVDRVEVTKPIVDKKTGEILKEAQIRTTFTVSLYCVRDLKEALTEHCKNCKHLHNLFFDLKNMNCEECKVTVLQKRLEKEIEDLANSLRKSFEGK